MQRELPHRFLLPEIPYPGLFNFITTSANACSMVKYCQKTLPCESVATTVLYFQVFWGKSLNVLVTSSMKQAKQQLYVDLHPLAPVHTQ